MRKKTSNLEVELPTFNIKFKIHWFRHGLFTHKSGLKVFHNKKSIDLDLNGVIKRVQPTTINNLLRGIMNVEGFPVEGSQHWADYRYRRKRKTMNVEIEINL